MRLLDLGQVCGLLVALLCACCSVWSPAEARLSYIAERTEKGTSYVVVGGTFEPSDNISDFFKVVRENNSQVVFFSSTGGTVTKAMELGHAIRALNMTTMQLRGTDCASACSLAFMGGTTRYAEPGSIGVHKSSFADTSGMTVEDAVSLVQQMTANVIAYMTEMGVDPGLLQLALQYDSSDIRYLSGSEMERYRVALSMTDKQAPSASASAFVPPSPASQPSVPPPALPQANPSVASLEPAQSPVKIDQPSLSIPVASTGRVQHPKGSVQMKAGPGSGTRTVAAIANGTPVTVLRDAEKWFQVRAGGKVGFMHHSWVWVEQYQAAPFGRKFVQVKSFDNLAETQKYIQASPLPLAAYLATNGWFAITLDHTFENGEVAASLVKSLKNSGSIPDDSVMTYGNAFVRKVCCSR